MTCFSVYRYVEGGGGIFKDMAIHDLDMARFLMGEEPEEIFAVGSCMINQEIADLPGPYVNISVYIYIYIYIYVCYRRRYSPWARA